MYRNATADDCGAIYSLVCDLEGTVLPCDAFAGIYRSQLEDGNYRCLVCDVEGSVVGFVNLRFEYQLHHAGRIAEVLELAVDPAFRRQSVGKGLLTEACKEPAGSGCSQIELACNQSRKDAHRFYEREGFRNSHYKFSKTLRES